MTFFPMLVNTLAGLQAAGRLERDLMHSYAAGYWRTLLVAAPAGGAAVHLQRAQGQRDAGADRRHRGRVLRLADRRGWAFASRTEAARMNMALVWAAIVVAAVTGSLALRAARLARAARRRSGTRRSAGMIVDRAIRGLHRPQGDDIEEFSRCARSTRLADAAAGRLLAAGRGRSAQDKVTVQLKWLPQAQFAGYYVAAGQGLLQGPRAWT